jgi:vacuolar-type H+-ATPase subunit E/Vma4
VTELVEEQRLALAPLRRALLANARGEADRIRRGAEEAAREAVAAAEHEVAEMLARARAQGEEEGAALRRTDEARARSDERARALAARRTVYDELRRRSRAAVRELLRKPGNRELLAETVRRTLGGRATVHDTDDGGLLGRADDGRVVDASVAVLVDRALAALDLEQLWTAA